MSWALSFLTLSSNSLLGINVESETVNTKYFNFEKMLQ